MAARSENACPNRIPPEAVRRLAIDGLTYPVVFKSMIDDWPSVKWTNESLAEILLDQTVKFRIGTRKWADEKGVLWERDCMYRDATLYCYNEWLNMDSEQLSEDNPLKEFPSTDYWCYADYKYMAHVFQDRTDILKSVKWSNFGFADRDGTESTIWIGSEGSHTPCHFDTYGCNLVAQIHGKKKWSLFAPHQTAMLYPTRIPYEESSVFSHVNITNPDLKKHPCFQDATPYVITLQPGDVLYVPRHWWHFVECLTPAISINTWIELNVDNQARLEESIVRLITCNMMSSKNTNDCSWLNPTEEMTSPEVNLEYLKAAMKSVDEKNTEQNQGQGEPVCKMRKTVQKSEQKESSKCSSECSPVAMHSSQCQTSLALNITECSSFIEKVKCTSSIRESTSNVQDSENQRSVECTEDNGKECETSLELLVECLTHPSVVRQVADLLKEKCSKK